MFKVIGDLGQVVAPLVMKRLIVFVTDSNRAAREGTPAPHIGHGIGLAIGLALLQMVYSICTAQTFARGGSVGILARGALIAAVYRRAMKMSGKARVTMTNSALVSRISTDISRIDFCASFFHVSAGLACSSVGLKLTFRLDSSPGPASCSSSKSSSSYWSTLASLRSLEWPSSSSRSLCKLGQ